MPTPGYDHTPFAVTGRAINRLVNTLLALPSTTSDACLLVADACMQVVLEAGLPQPEQALWQQAATRLRGRAPHFARRPRPAHPVLTAGNCGE